MFYPTKTRGVGDGGALTTRARHRDASADQNGGLADRVTTGNSMNPGLTSPGRDPPRTPAAASRATARRRARGHYRRALADTDTVVVPGS